MSDTTRRIPEPPGGSLIGDLSREIKRLRADLTAERAARERAEQSLEAFIAAIVRLDESVPRDPFWHIYIPRGLWGFSAETRAEAVAALYQAAGLAPPAAGETEGAACD